MNPMEKIRIIKEPFIKPVDQDESLLQFFERRFGKGTLPLLDAFVSGIFGGDPSKLSTELSFPLLKEAERMKGSVIKGLMNSKSGSKQKKKARKPFLLTPKGGMEDLLRNLAARVKVEYAVQISEIHHLGDIIKLVSDSQEWVANRVIVATGTQGVSNIKINGTNPEIEQPVAKVAVISLGYDPEAFTRPPKGYGFLIPEKEDRSVLGILFTSNIFSSKAPEGKILLRCFVGGARHAERAVLRKEEIVAMARKEVEELLGATLPPNYVSVQSHVPEGIPQLNLGHHKIIQWKEEAEENNPGLYFSGIGWTSISCDGLIGEAINLAQRLMPTTKK